MIANIPSAANGIPTNIKYLILHPASIIKIAANMQITNVALKWFCNINIKNIGINSHDKGYTNPYLNVFSFSLFLVSHAE